MNDDHDLTAGLPDDHDPQSAEQDFADYLAAAAVDIDRDFPPSVVEDSLRQILHDATHQADKPAHPFIHMTIPPHGDPTDPHDRPADPHDGPADSHDDDSGICAGGDTSAVPDTSWTTAHPCLDEPVNSGPFTNLLRLVRCCQDDGQHPQDTIAWYQSWLAAQQRRILEGAAQTAQRRADAMEDAALTKAARTVEEARQRADDILSQANREAAVIISAANAKVRQTPTDRRGSLTLSTAVRPATDVDILLTYANDPPQLIAAVTRNIVAHLCAALPWPSIALLLEIAKDTYVGPMDNNAFHGLRPDSRRLPRGDWQEPAQAQNALAARAERNMGDHRLPLAMEVLLATHYTAAPGRDTWQRARRLLRHGMRMHDNELLVVSFPDRDALVDTTSSPPDLAVVDMSFRTTPPDDTLGQGTPSRHGTVCATS